MIVVRCKKILSDLYTRVLRCCGSVESKKVVFMSFGGKNYSDNPRSISEALHSIAPDAQIYWFLSDADSKKDLLPQYIRYIDPKKRFSVRWNLATARVIVSNSMLPTLPKGKKQFFVQTWHGDKAFKKVLYDSIFIPGDFHLSEEQPGYCDIAIAGSEYGKRQYKSAFRYNGKILMEGTPRNDRLVQNDPNLRSEIKRAIGLDENVCVLLYAPTLRRSAAGNNGAQQIQDINISATLDALERKNGEKWCCFLRAHPGVGALCGASEDSRILNVSKYEDMADLLLVADMLITDYSSCAGDFALLKRPVILYQSDRQEYLDKDRTFYFDIEESPYLVAENQEQLEQIIGSITQQKAAENCDAILRFYGDVETGHASERVAKIIVDWINEERRG